MHIAITNEKERRKKRKQGLSKNVYDDKCLELISLNNVLEEIKEEKVCLKTAPTIYYSHEIINHLQEKLSEYPDKRFLKRHFVKVLFFISSVYYFNIIDFKKNKDKEFVEIPYRFFRSVIGQRHYPKVLDIVLSTGVIKTDGHFIYNGPKGKGCELRKKTEEWTPGKAYGYRLNKKFKKVGFKALKTNLKIGKGLLKFKTEDQEYLIKCLNRASLPVDMAQEVVEYSDKSEKAKDIQFKLIEQFENKEFFQSISEKTSRVYNTLSSLQREVRYLVRLDNEPSIEIDISGSQPLLLNEFYTKETEESYRFKELTESGEFYKKLAKETGLDYMETRKLKDELYRVLFGPCKWNYEQKILSWFLFKFPELWHEIIKHKQKHHSEVPIILQQKESDVVICGVVRQFRELNIPILTVHDSFIVRRRDKELLEKTIKEQFYKLYKLIPKTKEVAESIRADYYWDDILDKEYSLS